jgi:hypothetical protein
MILISYIDNVQKDIVMDKYQEFDEPLSILSSVKAIKIANMIPIAHLTKNIIDIFKPFNFKCPG